ncbi:hypothetical protein KDAU_65090 [Dictyobacter aurantiacus]|uniref:Uncharacterized protein n=1 Tax=Dictyobacter aurantiacus TaxID=1936993 RepID=A0A401ZQV0_9CHLR|nr:hypothetical protein KDAU_65090 [Dictyobacter aurantiacus]
MGCLSEICGGARLCCFSPNHWSKAVRTVPELELNIGKAMRFLSIPVAIAMASSASSWRIM